MHRRLFARALVVTALLGAPCVAVAQQGSQRAPQRRHARVAPPAPRSAVARRRDASTAPREVKDPNDPHEQRILKLRERLLELLHEKPLSKTRVGVEVMTVSDGDVLFAHNAAQRFNPASNTKILTTAAAMAYLGSDYRYYTAVYGPEPDESGVIHGDVVLRGSGDPSLGLTDLADVARGLAARGVTRIEGDLYGDPRFHDAHAHAEEGVGEGALILNRNTYAVRVRPNDVGQRALVSVEPPTDYFVIENQATTVHGKRTRLRIDAYRKENRLIVTVRGRIADNRDDYGLLRRLPDGALFAASALKTALADFGVEVTGIPRSGAGDGGGMLAEHRSAPLGQVCRISNKPSNNFVADTIYKTLGAELYGLPGTFAKGTRAVLDYLGAVGLDPNGVRIVNGSGLTHENRIRPADLATLLRAIYYDVALAPELLASLAVAGIDGTIRNRFLGTTAVGLVRAKTGTLDSVSALSGYVGDKDDVIVFTIFVEGFRNRRLNEIRHAQVRMVDAMLRYLRADAPSADGQPVEPSIDSEADGDPTPE